MHAPLANDCLEDTEESSTVHIRLLLLQIYPLYIVSIKHQCIVEVLCLL